MFPSYSRDYAPVWRFTLLVALLQGCYASAFIVRTSFVVEGQRYFCLFDDAMISMRYAANWANGQGLVWNPGERVEGYTNFGWTFIMAACHLPHLSAQHTCLCVQILGIPLLWSCLAATVLLSRSCRLLPVTAACAVTLVATYYNLLFLSLFGMETALVTLVVTLALRDGVESIRRNQGRIRVMLWMSLAVLVRPDSAVIAVFLLGYLMLVVRRGRLRMIAGLFALIIVALLHALWRHSYYGEWLPNTYYLKATGWPLLSRIGVGLEQSLWTLGTLALPILLAAVSMLTRKQAWHMLGFGLFVTTVLYETYLGGDAWPLSRFVIPSVIGLFVMAADGIRRVMVVFISQGGGTRAAAARVCLVGLCVMAVNAVHWDHYLLYALPQTVEGNRGNVMYMLAIEKASQSEASVAVAWAGAIPYYSGRRSVDLLGKCDRHIARLPVVHGLNRPGHNKFDWEYSFSRHRPDIAVHIVPLNTSYYRRHYRPIAVEIDGQEVALAVRTDSIAVTGGQPISWDRAVRIMRKTLHGDM